MNSTISIFCINLERATERRQIIKSEWIDKLKLDIKFWKAYDRRDIELGKYKYKYSNVKAKQIIDRPLSFGEIACATSFCMLYEHILSSGLEEVIIMEDDILPLIDNKQLLFDKIDEGKQEFPEAIMMLLHQYRDFFPTKICNIQKTNFSMCDPAPWGNQLFYANKKCIQKLYNLLNPITFPADYPQRILSKNHTVIVSNEPLCSHPWHGPESTTYIGNEFRNTHRRFIL